MANQKNNTQQTEEQLLTQSEAFVTKYKKQIIIALVAIAAIVGGCFAYYYGFLKPREEKAQAFIAQGQIYAIQGDYDKALQGDGRFPGFVKVAKEYSFTDAANFAKAWAGICYAHQEKWAEAVKYLEDFSPAGDNSLSPAAMAALANCYAATNKVDKAIDKFKDAAKKADNPVLSAQYLLQAGQLLESQGKADEALKVYQQIKNDYPTSQLCTSQPANGGVMVTPEIDRYIERVQK